MDIWIVDGGKKSGPMPEFEVRSRIGSGMVNSKTLAWLDGMQEWRPLGEIPIFKREFDTLNAAKKVDAPEHEFDEHPIAGKSDNSSRGEILKDTTSDRGSAYIIRRFWARWLDLYLYSGFWWLGMWAAGQDIAAILENFTWLLLQYVPWFAIEAWMIQQFGTTPGKWLLGIRVCNDDGSGLTMKASIWRSIRVMLLGIGLGWGLLPLLCQIMALITTRRLGRPLWDVAGGHRLECRPMNSLRILACACGFFIALQMQLIVMAPHVMRQMKRDFPALYEMMRENPPWHLPEKRPR
ncbi:MAG: RDD family protein [Luteolibacter sp.]